jgi:hypothetical protein
MRSRAALYLAERSAKVSVVVADAEKPSVALF